MENDGKIGREGKRNGKIWREGKMNGKIGEGAGKQGKGRGRKTQLYGNGEIRNKEIGSA